MKENNLSGLFAIFKNPRFKLWKVFLVVSMIFLGLLILQIAFVYLIPAKELAKNGFDVEGNNIAIKDTHQIYSAIFHTLFYYFSLNLFYQANVLKKRLTVYLFIILLCLLFLSFNQIISTIFFDYKTITGKPVLLLISYLLSTLFYAVIIFVILSLANAGDQRKRNEELLIKNTALELEKVKAEHDFLKAQINPHFLHNSLNFLYSKALPYSSELSEGILTLSEIMRYSLLSENDKDGLVLLANEVEHIRNIIKMNQLRFENKLNVQFEINGILNGIKILPLVLITIVENAFKHGDIKDSEMPLSFVLEIGEGKMFFTSKNRIAKGKKELTTGIGLDNTRKRIELFYGKNAQMKIFDDGDIYLVELKIPF